MTVRAHTIYSQMVGKRPTFVENCFFFSKLPNLKMPKRLYGTHDGCPRSVSYGSQQLDKIPPSPASGGRICIKPTLTPRTSGDGTFLYSQPPPRSRETARWPYFYGLIHGTAVWPRVLKPYQIGSWDHYQGEFTMKPAFSHQTVFCGSLMLSQCGFHFNWF